MTLDNEEATILVGQEVPITTGETLLDGNSNPFRTTQRQDIGVKLVVRPQINAGGSITLFLRQEVSSINGVLTDSAQIAIQVTAEGRTGGGECESKRVAGERENALRLLTLIAGFWRYVFTSMGWTNFTAHPQPSGLPYRYRGGYG